MFYKIVDITDHDGNTKIDPVYQKRIGRIVSSINFVPITQPALFDGRMVVDWFNPVIVGIRAALTYAYDNQGNPMFGKILYTSKVKENTAEQYDNNYKPKKVIITTENSIYHLEECEVKE